MTETLLALITEPRTWLVLFVLTAAKATVSLAFDWSDQRSALLAPALGSLLSTPVAFVILLVSGLGWPSAAAVIAAVIAIDAAVYAAFDRKSPRLLAGSVVIGNLVAWGVFLGLLAWATVVLQRAVPTVEERSEAAAAAKPPARTKPALVPPKADGAPEDEAPPHEASAHPEVSPSEAPAGDAPRDAPPPVPATEPATEPAPTAPE